MSNTLEHLEISPEVVSTVFGSIQEVSAFQRASRPVNVTWKGITTHVLGGSRARFVEEGKAKPVADAATTVTLTPQKLAVVDVYSNELETVAEDAVNALRNHAAFDFARKIDAAISGSEKVGTTDKINALSSAPTLTLTDRASVVAAKSAASAETPASAWVISTQLYDELDAMTNAQGGILFPSLEAEGRLVGLPVYTYVSSEASGFVGDFQNSAAFGIVAPPTGMVRTSREGSFGNPPVSMAETNQIAFITEIGVAFGVSNAANFRKVVVAGE